LVFDQFIASITFLGLENKKSLQNQGTVVSSRMPYRRA